MAAVTYLKQLLTLTGFETNCKWTQSCLLKLYICKVNLAVYYRGEKAVRKKKKKKKKHVKTQPLLPQHENLRPATGACEWS